MNLGLSGRRQEACSPFPSSRSRRICRAAGGPGFERALPADEARPLYDHFCRALELLGVPVATGVFGAMMEVELVNDGPATFLLDVR